MGRAFARIVSVKGSKLVDDMFDTCSNECCVAPCVHEIYASSFGQKIVETMGAVPARPVVVCASVCQTVAWPLSPQQSQQPISHSWKQSFAAAWLQ